MKAQSGTSIRAYLATAFSITVLYVCLAANSLGVVDLKGEWTFNAQKSKLGTSQYPIAPLKIRISADPNGLAIERTTAGFNGGDNMVTTDHLTFDGKESESTVFGNSKKKCLASWSAEGSLLTVRSTILFDQNGTQREFKSTEVYSLSADGKLLSINFSSQSFEGLDGTFAYDKTN